MIINKNLKIFFCGIGGIGMSGLALLARSCGFEVFGSNNVENKNTKMLQEQGIQVFIGHKPENIQGSGLVVYTTAINLHTNCEIIEAYKQNIPVIQRCDMLSILMNNYFNIVIAGSHGKTTTTSLIWHILEHSGLHPNLLVGGVINEKHSNCVSNSGRDFVVEADESDGSFLKMPADIGILTNINPEHMDYYGSSDILEIYFLKFAEKCVEKGGVVICIDDKIGEKIAKNLKNNEKYKNIQNKIITYGMENKEADFFCENIRFTAMGLIFDVKTKDEIIQDIQLSQLFGEKNALNSTAGLAVAKLMKMNLQQSSQTLESFQGVQKRFTIVGKINNVIVVDDYAHNTQKIASCMQSAHHYMKLNNLKGKLTVVFEPHRYTRVRDSIDGMVQSLKTADNIVVLPIYASSEEPIDGITQDFIVQKLRAENPNVFTCSNEVEDIKQTLKKIATDGIIVFMGAGLSSKISHEILK